MRSWLWSLAGAIGGDLGRLHSRAAAVLSLERSLYRESAPVAGWPRAQTTMFSESAITWPSSRTSTGT